MKIERDIKKEKAQFIYNNKEILKDSLMVKINVDGKNKMIMSLLLSILLTDLPLEEIDAYLNVQEFVDNNIALYKEEYASESILGTIKIFLKKFSDNQEETKKLISKINEYEFYIGTLRYSDQNKVKVKVG